MSPLLRRDVRHRSSVMPVPSVLVVEPDPVLRQFLRRLLERHGVDTLLAPSAEQALVVLGRDDGALRVVVHGATLLHGDDARLAARFGRLEPVRHVVVYGGAGMGPSTSGAAGNGVAGRGATVHRGGPFDGEALARDVLQALRRRTSRD
jgi:DNA-binding NtrC family response regulator